MRNLWGHPLQRLNIYCQPFQISEGYYKVSSQASCNGPDWIGLERCFTIIEETIPFRLLNRKEHSRLLWAHFRGPIESIQGTACVLIDHLNNKPNFFHWFLDALPRVFAAEEYQERFGVPCHLIVPEPLQPWQSDSLMLLGVQAERMIRIPNSSGFQGFRFGNLVSTFSHRHIRHSPTGHFDAFSPEAIRLLSTRLAQGADRSGAANPLGNRLYISRGNVKHRRVRNEDLVMDLLSPHGFQRVCLENHPLRDQILMFRDATHVIAPHGGALTNLLHVSEGCQVLEIFQTGHGPRPDFFQLSALKGATYSFDLAKSLNPGHDIDIPAPVLRTFLEASL